MDDGKEERSIITSHTDILPSDTFPTQILSGKCFKGYFLPSFLSLISSYKIMNYVNINYAFDFFQV
jgi:hypothetical protein